MTKITLAAAIGGGRLSSAEVVEAHLEQIARHSPALNAIVTLDDGGRPPPGPGSRRRPAGRGEETLMKRCF